MFDKKNHFSRELILFLEPSQLYIYKEKKIFDHISFHNSLYIS
jgi:hypothetical protein